MFQLTTEGFDHQEGIIINPGRILQLILVRPRHPTPRWPEEENPLGREHLGIQSELIKVRLKVFEANSTISEKDKPACANRAKKRTS